MPAKKAKPLKKSELEHLLNFIGYGRLDAPVWFLGMEERGSAKSFPARLKFKRVEDLKRAHMLTDIREHHIGKRRIQPTWRGMCYLMLSCRDEETGKESIRNYQSDQLGRSNGDTLLLELLPIPKKKAHEWEYKEIIPQFENLEDYHAQVMDRRIRDLRGIFKKNHPSVVVCYGRKFWKHYREIFAPESFTRDKDAQFEQTRIGETLVVLCHHFVAPTMNKNLKNLAKIVCNHLN